jgi:hypothetical protein
MPKDVMIVIHHVKFNTPTQSSEHDSPNPLAISGVMQWSQMDGRLPIATLPSRVNPTTSQLRKLFVASPDSRDGLCRHRGVWSSSITFQVSQEAHPTSSRYQCYHDFSVCEAGRESKTIKCESSRIDPQFDPQTENSWRKSGHRPQEYRFEYCILLPHTTIDWGTLGYLNGLGWLQH